MKKFLTGDDVDQVNPQGFILHPSVVVASVDLNQTNHDLLLSEVPTEFNILGYLGLLKLTTRKRIA